MSIDLCRWVVQGFSISSSARARTGTGAAWRRVIEGTALAACLCVPLVHAGKPGPSCSEVPVKWTMEYSSDYNLYGDGNPYDGTLFICGSGDVTMNLAQTSRYVNNSLSPLAATNANSPA